MSTFLGWVFLFLVIYGLAAWCRALHRRLGQLDRDLHSLRLLVGHQAASTGHDVARLRALYAHHDDILKAGRQPVIVPIRSFPN
jgi:hypothetical protein